MIVILTDPARDLPELHRHVPELFKPTTPVAAPEQPTSDITIFDLAELSRRIEERAMPRRSGDITRVPPFNRR